jgi:hypothetical protein
MIRASAEAVIPMRHSAMAQMKSFICMMFLLLLVRFVSTLDSRPKNGDIQN